MPKAFLFLLSLFLITVHAQDILITPGSTRDTPLSEPLGDFSNKVLDPFIFVPGLGGSVLDAKLDKHSGPHWYCDRWDDWYHIWISVTQIITVDCFKDNMHLRYEPGNDTYHNTPGVSIRPRDYGGLKGVLSLDPGLPELSYYAHKMMDSLKKVGYVPGKNLFAAPYDWRIASPKHSNTNGQFAALERLVETAYEKGGHRRVHLAGHSLGAPFIQNFLATRDAAWKAKHVATFISLNGAFGGSIYATSLAVTGTIAGISWAPKAALRDITRSVPSVLWMYPAPDAAGDAPVLYTLERAYKAHEIAHFLANECGSPHIPAMYQSIAPLIGVGRPPQVECHMFWSESHNTSFSVEYTHKDYSIPPVVKETRPGDRTVTKEGLLLFRKWRQAQPIHEHKIPEDHMGVIYSDSVLNTILSIITH
eukprot:gnl/Trimastix_PCT/950.p1 GENE.gnl/Trimastix_PCT/950~~gnl/Trimastix_PCT/950.p1  ORF type:complete len:420 (+),score=111.27 gnl/Trimastix_PCT/950:43-1302(+)